MAKLKKTLPKEFLDMCNTHSNVWTPEEIDECKQLLSGCEPDATPRGGKTTSLHLRNIPIEIVAWQIGRGADVNAPDTYGTPLFTHAGSGRYDVCKLLIDNGADVSAFDYADKTALFTAADRGQIEVVKLLLEKGANPYHRGNRVVDGKTALLFMLGRMNPGSEEKAEVADILLNAMGGKKSISNDDLELARKYVSDKGESFEFQKSGWEKEYRIKGEKAMKRFYELFDVEPPKSVVKHDGKSSIIVDKTLSVGKIHDALWDYLVPPRGVCDTVQGEVIRITGRIGDEVYRNGGINWDGEYRKMMAALKEYFVMGNPLTEADIEEVRNASLRINNSKACGCEKDVSKLQELAVRWVSLNSEPVKLGAVEYNR